MRISDWSSDVCSSDLAIADRSSGLNQNENTNAMRRAARAYHVISNVPTGSSKSPLCGERGRRPNRALQALAHLRVENRSAEHTYELPYQMRISYAFFCLKTKKMRISHPLHHTKNYKKI